MNEKRNNLSESKRYQGINDLNNDNLLSAIIIGVTLLTIIGNNVYKRYYETGKVKYVEKSRIIYITGLIIALGIYLIFEKSNYENLKNKVMNSDNPTPAFVRLVGSVLVVIGTLCFIYYQFNEEYPGGGPED